jgi:hypothetical protein
LPGVPCPLGVAFLLTDRPRNESIAGACGVDLGFDTIRPDGRLQGFAPAAELVHDHDDVIRCGPSMLSWVFPSLGIARLGDGATFVTPPLMCLPQETSLVAQSRFSKRTLECRSTVVVASSLSRVPFPSEVCRLLRSHRFGEFSRPGLSFPLGAKATSPSPW